MPKNTFAAFIVAGTMGFVGGLVSLFSIGFLFSYCLTAEPNYFIFVVIGFLINVIGPLIFCTGFLLPLAVIDKTKIEELSFSALIKRYVPILSLPFPMLFLYVLFQNYDYPGNKYFSILSAINSFSVCVICLLFFIKRLKSV